MSPSLTAQEFVAKWRRADVKERSGAQEHFIDLCRLVGSETPVESDPTGQTFTFEAGADKQHGGHGWADVWKKGHFAFEYKGRHADLDKAYAQLQQYRESLQNPPLLVVCDLDRIIIHTNFTDSVKKTYTLALDDFLTPASLNTLRAVFFDPYTLRAPKTTAQATQEAAAEFARLSELLRRYGADPQKAAHFLIRILFCLFAEDVGLLQKDLLKTMVEQARRKPAQLTQQLRQLFRAMAGGGYFGPVQVLHFNGGLFDDDAALDLDSDSLDILTRISSLDWSSIEPSIFGTLFERSLDPGKRSQLGAHYTDKSDIVLIVEPVLMAPLRRRWAEVQAQARALAAKRDSATGKAKSKPQKDLTALLTGFAHELATTTVLDAACGSGNFLYVSLRLLLDMEKEVILLAGDLGVGRFFPQVNPAQLYGIEINEYAHELAQITVWIGYIQWLQENGFGSPSEPILKPLHNIVRMDAIMNPDGTEPEWPPATVIVGNPPFLGGSKLRRELGDEYIEKIFELYDGRVAGGIDFVCYWFEKARAMIKAGTAKRVGLLATQAIRMGASRTVLERIKSTGDIFWAQSNREWILDGASIRVSMVGFDDGSEEPRELDGRQVAIINSDLTTRSDLTTAQTLVESRSICFRSDEKGGPFDIDESLAKQMLAAPNPTGRPNSDVVRPYYNARDVTQRWKHTWIIDFGSQMPHDQAALYEQPFEYIKRVVKPVRAKSRDERERKYWWLHRRPGPDMRDAISNLNRYIVTPAVSKHRIFSWLDKTTIPDHRLHVIARSDDYFFGVLHSRCHEVWGLATSSRHGVGNDPVYNITTCFETFAFPWPPGQEPQDDHHVQAIAEAARELVQLRDNWLNPPGIPEADLKKRTLTNLYNQRPTWLDNAHKKLDVAVFAAYGWPLDLSDDDILARLLALNLERAK